MKNHLNSVLPPVLPGHARLADVDVMCCREVQKLPEGADWIYEMKIRGCRVLVVKSEKQVQLVTRNHRPLGEWFPQIEEAVSALPCKNVTFDAVLVALDSRGRVIGCPLEMMQSGRVPTRVQLRILDLLAHESAYVQGLPYAVRKQRLRQMLPAGLNSVKLVEELSGSVQSMLEMALAAGQPGVVAKRADSSYEEGERSGAWVKYLVSTSVLAVRRVPARSSSRGKAGLGVNDVRRRKAA